MNPNTILALVQWLANVSNAVSLPRVLRLYAIILLMPLGVGIADAWGFTMTGATFSDLPWDVRRGGWVALLSIAGGILSLAAADVDAKRARDAAWDRAQADADAKREAQLTSDPILAKLAARADEAMRAAEERRAARAAGDPPGVVKS